MPVHRAPVNCWHTAVLRRTTEQIRRCAHARFTAASARRGCRHRRRCAQPRPVHPGPGVLVRKNDHASPSSRPVPTRVPHRNRPGRDGHHRSVTEHRHVVSLSPVGAAPHSDRSSGEALRAPHLRSTVLPGRSGINRPIGHQQFVTASGPPLTSDGVTHHPGCTDEIRMNSAGKQYAGNRRWVHVHAVGRVESYWPVFGAPGPRTCSVTLPAARLSVRRRG